MQWRSLGAPRLHIVDLDGAATGTPQNLESARQIAQGAMVPTQFGGGVRSLETIKEVLEAGIDRVIISTAAVEDLSLIHI